MKVVVLDGKQYNVVIEVVLEGKQRKCAGK